MSPSRRSAWTAAWRSRSLPCFTPVGTASYHSAAKLAVNRRGALLGWCEKIRRTLDMFGWPSGCRELNSVLKFFDWSFCRIASRCAKDARTAFGTTEGWLGVYHPVLLAELPEEVAECAR